MAVTVPDPFAAPDSVSAPGGREALAVWWRIGLLSFGGPAAQIALMHRTLVDEKRWLSEREFLDALGFCMLLPGPEAMQLATWAGRRLHGVRGGLIAGGLFVLPGAVVILLLAALYAELGALPWVQALFLGIQATVVVIVMEALLRVSKRALIGPRDRVIAATAFAALFLFDLPFPLVIGVAAAIGMIGSKASAPGDHHVVAMASLRDTARTAVVWLALWWLPLLGIAALTTEPLWQQLGTFFSLLATLTFGGAYAVLAWMVQDVVTAKGWLTGEQMLAALGLAETTPGPLILVTEFVGFLAAHRLGGFWYGVAGAAITLWATFVPCFLWIFTFGPWIDRLSASERVRGALSAITAAVVGVILNLSVWFALHVFFGQVTRDELGPLVLWTPTLSSWQPLTLLLAIVAGVLLLQLHWSLLRVLPLMAVAGLVPVLLFGP